jgi:beta-glucosidase
MKPRPLRSGFFVCTIVLAERRQAVDDSIRQKITALSLDEKISSLSGLDYWHLRPIPRLGIAGIMVADGPHGLRKQTGPADQLGLGDSVPATCFPSAVTLASSWDRTVLHHVGVALARECRAEHVSVLLGPGINIKRSPLGGRNFEYYSEDPYLAGTMAASFIDGVQSQGIGTSLKHFAVNNQESFRMVVDAVVDTRTLMEIYLAGFEIAVRQAHPWTVMCSYNKLNGIHTSDNAWLLDTVLRRTWGFEGAVISDWGATNDRVLGLEAGLDLEMPGNEGAWDAVIRDAVASGRLDESVIDRTIARSIQLVDKAQPVLGADWHYDPDTHHMIAQWAAEQSSVLLKNDADTLPLSHGLSIAIIGAFAREPRYQGAGSSQVHPTRLDAAYEHIAERAESRFAPGFDPERTDIDAVLEGEALRIAAESDVVLFFAGLPAARESEGFDRVDLRLPTNQEHLLSRIAAATRHAGRRIAVVLSNGGPLEMPWIDGVDAVLEGYLGGQAGGAAIARLLFGDVAPSGKLAETFPLRLDDTPAYHYFPGSARTVEYREGLYVGYRYYDSAHVPVLFPFGHGLSYTSFTYGDMRLSAGSMRVDDILLVQCSVRNTGDRSGSEVVQLYVHARASTVYRPEQELKGFEKVNMEPGASVLVSFRLDARSFAFFDVRSGAWQVESGIYDIRIGSSSSDIRLVAPVAVQSAFEPAIDPGLRSQLAVYYRVAVADTVPDAAFEALMGRPSVSKADGSEFDLDTPLLALRSRLLGRLVVRLLELMLAREAKRSRCIEDSVLPMAFLEMPVRALVLLGKGRFSFRQAEALLKILNAHPLWAISRLMR